MCEETPTRSQIEAILGGDVASTRKWEREAFDRLVAPFGRSLVLFGAGSLGQQVLERLRREGVEPTAFADNNPALHGTSINGLTVLSPEEAAARFGPSAAFVVTIWNTHHLFVETRAQLTALGCERVVSAVPLRWKYAEDLLPFFWLDLPSKTHEEAGPVMAALSVWADDLSRREFLGHLRFRICGDFDAVPVPVRQASYFPDDIFAVHDQEAFVDCGAFDGITTRQLLERLPSFAGRIVAFEPDPDNFASLNTYVQCLPSSLKARIAISSSAVGAARGRLRFNATGTMGSAVDPNGAVEVDCDALDMYLQDSQMVPSYVKMDIEGAELDALTGARETIQRHTPVLAVCLYHRLADLWRIPLYLHALTDRYSLFLRSHEPEGWQLVCYAVPTDRLLANTT